MGFWNRRILGVTLRWLNVLEMLFEIIELFEGARKPDYNREMFDFYDELHRGKTGASGAVSARDRRCLRGRSRGMEERSP